MKNDVVITIGRQYGSGGRLIGKEVAERLGVPFYDKELIELAAKESGYSPEFIKANEQRSTFGFLSNLAAQGFSYSKDTLPPADTLFIAQCKVIQDVSDNGPCVIVGRCADYILRDRADAFHVFIRSDLPHAIKRVTEDYGVPADQAEAEIKRINKTRAAHCRR
jgi:cytidylate kinase